MQNSLTKNLYVQPRKSTVILSSIDVITCYNILDVSNFDIRTKNPRSAPVRHYSIHLLHPFVQHVSVNSLKPAPFHTCQLEISNMSFIICFSSFLISLSIAYTLISPLNSSTCSGSASIHAVSCSSNSPSTVVTLHLIPSNSTEANYSFFLIALA